MKKIVAGLLIFLMMVSLCACGSPSPEEVRQSLAEEADAIVSDWKDEIDSSGSMVRFSTELYEHETAGWIYYIEVEFTQALFDYTEYDETMMALLTNEIYEDYFPEVEAVFEEHDVTPSILFGDGRDGSVHAIGINGELNRDIQ